MKACPACGKPAENWHSTCLRKLFGVSELPVISCIGTSNMVELALESAGRLLISGVQAKLSVKVANGNVVPAVKNGTHILKPLVPQWREMPQNENLVMCLARVAGIEVPPHGILKNEENETFYIVKRFDRKKNGIRIHTEDFCQAGNVPRTMKYRKSAEFCGKLINRTATFPKIEIQKYFKIVLFNFLVGNGDAHLKNYSFIYHRNRTALAPAYDLVSSSILIPEETQSAIPVDGRDNGLRLKNFKALGDNMNILPETIQRNIQMLLAKIPVFFGMIEIADFSDEMKEALKKSIRGRASVLGREVE